jgi:beta-mannosidase
VDLYFEIEKLIMEASADAELHYEILLDNKVVKSGQADLLLAGGLNFHKESVSIENPQLWWPNGYGAQTQYTIRAWCVCNGHNNEYKPQKFGIRTIELDQSRLEDGTRNYFFKVNGVRVFCRGGNWVPADSVYLRVTDEKYRTLIQEAKEANFTMLRIWGGGQYEHDTFYEACSDAGILLMHDFMYACAFYPDHLDWFLHEAREEAWYQTKRLAHYPCMAVWTGNNEIHESYTDWFKNGSSPVRLHGEKIFNYIQPEAVHANCPQIPYMPSSPYYGDERANQVDMGDVHAWTFFTRDPDTKFKFNYELEAFDRFNARFSSEYGFHGPLVESSVKRFFDGEDIAFGSPVWEYHGEDIGKHNGLLEMIDRHITDAKELDECGYLLHAGILQGCFYSELVDPVRTRPYSAGNLIWMYNDCCQLQI